MTDRRALVLGLLLGCGSNGKSTSDDQQTPGSGYRYDHSVQITAPLDGDTVDANFSVVYEAGADVTAVELTGPEPALHSTPEDGSGTIAVDDLPDGHTALLLTGYDADGAQINTHGITIRVTEPGEPWVTITSPEDGAETHNPVVFAVAGSSEVDTIELLADDWSIGTVSPGQILSYTFDGTGYPRTIVARGTADDIEIATDTIQITVQPSEEVPTSDMSTVLWDIAQTYPTDGTHDYYWPTSGGWAGTTQDIWYRDEQVAEGDPEGRCYCVGLTWEVYMQAFEQLEEETGGDGTLNGLTVDELYSFRTDFYVRELLGSGVVEALENYGLGEEVTDWEDAQPGDIMQLWRYSSSGHSVLFESWERDLDGTIVGVNYWSTQTSTNGIGANTEYFGTSDYDLNPSRCYIARPWSPVDWLPW